MARNGSGAFTPTGIYPASSSTLIESAKFNTYALDVAAALTASIAKDGQTTITANLPMGTYRHTGVGDGQALTDYSSVNQVIDNALTYDATETGTGDAYEIQLPISPDAYTSGQRFQFIASEANVGACTLNVNSLGAVAIVNQDGSSLLDNDIIANMVVDVLYNGTNFVLISAPSRFVTKLVDSNGNDVVSTSATASAVNEITVANAATGNKPSINQSGADDVGIDIEGIEFKNGVVTGALVGGVTGNSTTSTNWASASSITLTGDVTGSGSINGTTNASFATTIAPGAIHQGHITAGSTLNSTGAASLTITTSDQFEFTPMHYHSTGIQQTYVSHTSYSLAAYARAWTLNNPGATSTAYMRTTYISASPPYDLGDGEIARFVFALIDRTTREVVAVQVATDAPWHGMAKRTIGYDKNGVALKKSRNALGGIEISEVTHADKNKHMNIIPHPFINGNDLTNLVPVLLDPVSPIMLKIAEMQDMDEDANALFHNGDLIIDNTPLPRSGPAGLLIPSVRWRNIR